MAKTDEGLSPREKLVASIWSTTVGMVALAAIFSQGNPVAIAVPPIAAAATSMFILNTDEQRKRIPEQAEKMQQIELRLETLETILTGSDYERLGDSVPSPHSSQLSDHI